MVLWSLLILSASSSWGFLLNQNNGSSNSQTITDKQYITMTDFLKMKMHQEQELEKSFSLLSMQLQHKFSLLQHSTLNNVTVNETSVNWEQKYQKLQENNTDLQFRFDDLLRKYMSLETELSSLKNKTLELTKMFASLEGLRNADVVTKLNDLQQKINVIGAKTFVLDSNEQARNRDITVLYNRTSETEKSLKDLEDQTNKQLIKLEHGQNTMFKEIEIKFQNISGNPNISIFEIMEQMKVADSKYNTTSVHIENQIQEIEMRQNLTKELLLRRISEANDKVGMTACVSVDGVKRHGSVIEFDQIRSHVGIVNLSTLRSTGKFTCEKAGLYLVSVVINTPTTDASFSIYLNGNSMSKLVISGDSHVDTGTSVLAAELQIDDIVWVQADSDTHVYFHWSCMTIVKL